MLMRSVRPSTSLTCLRPFSPPQIVHRVRESLEYVKELDPVTRAIVRSSYEEAVHATLWFAVVLAAAAAFFSFLIKEAPLGGPMH